MYCLPSIKLKTKICQQIKIHQGSGLIKELEDGLTLFWLTPFRNCGITWILT
jgi:hypothetical protein